MTDQERARVGTPTWTEADDQRLRSLAQSGMTSREIAGEIGRPISTVQYRAKKLGLSLKQVMVRRHESDDAKARLRRALIPLLVGGRTIGPVQTLFAEFF